MPVATLNCPACPPAPIFYTLVRGDDWDLARLPVTDTEPEMVNLTHNPGHDTGPTYAAAGWWLAFQSDRDGNWEIYTTDLFGRHQTQQTSDPASDTNPAWSPGCGGSTLDSVTGTIAFQSDRSGNWDIFLLNVGTSEANTDPFPVTSDPGSDTDPFWSPDGSALAFQSDRGGDWNIFTINPDGSDETQRTDDPADEIDPAWSPDGSAIAYVSNRGGDWDLYLLDLIGGQELQLTSGKGDDLWPAWSPRGRWIAFQSDWDGDWEIYVYDVVANALLRLTDDPANDEAPAWDCGGNRVLFHSDRDGDADVYSVALNDPTDVIQLTDQDSTEQDVLWQPASRGGTLPPREELVEEEITQEPTATPTVTPSLPTPPPIPTGTGESDWMLVTAIGLLLISGLGALWFISTRRKT
jgi:TolB protein